METEAGMKGGIRIGLVVVEVGDGEGRAGDSEGEEGIRAWEHRRARLKGKGGFSKVAFRNAQFYNCYLPHRSKQARCKKCGFKRRKRKGFCYTPLVHEPVLCILPT